MDNWKQRFRQAVVKGGPLAGARYLDVNEDWLLRAATSYKQDARFEKFARMATGSSAAAEPLPGTPAPEAASVELAASCKPCRVAKRAVQPGIVPSLKVACSRLWALPRCLRVWVVVALCVVLMRPLAVAVIAKLLGGVLRLLFRRLLELVLFVLEQLLEELLQQAADAVSVPFAADQAICPAQLTVPLLSQLLLVASSSAAGAFAHYVSLRLRTRPVLRL